jgi:hypothetical protein
MLFDFLQNEIGIDVRAVSFFIFIYFIFIFKAAQLTIKVKNRSVTLQNGNFVCGCAYHFLKRKCGIKTGNMNGLFRTGTP